MRVISSIFVCLTMFACMTNARIFGGGSRGGFGSGSRSTPIIAGAGAGAVTGIIASNAANNHNNHNDSHNVCSSLSPHHILIMAFVSSAVTSKL